MSYLELARRVEAQLREETSGYAIDAKNAKSRVAAAPSSGAPDSTPAPSPMPDNLDRVLALPLSQLSACLRVRGPWLDVPLWFVPGEADAVALVGRGDVTRGAVWTVAELTDLLAIPGITKPQARTVAIAKAEFGGDLVDVIQCAPAEATDPAKRPAAGDCPVRRECVPGLEPGWLDQEASQ
jgi:hypothetical protein